MLISGFRRRHFLPFVQGLKNRARRFERKSICVGFATRSSYSHIVLCHAPAAKLPMSLLYNRSAVWHTPSFLCVQCPRIGKQASEEKRESNIHRQSVIYGLRVARLPSCKPARCLARCSGVHTFCQPSETSRARNSALDETKHPRRSSFHQSVPASPETRHDGHTVHCASAERT